MHPGVWPRPRCSSRPAWVPASSPSDTPRRTGRRSRPASSSSIPCPSIDREVSDVCHHSHRCLRCSSSRSELFVSHRRAAGASGVHRARGGRPWVSTPCPASSTAAQASVRAVSSSARSRGIDGAGQQRDAPVGSGTDAAPTRCRCRPATSRAFDDTASAAWRVEATLSEDRRAMRRRWTSAGAAECRVRACSWRHSIERRGTLDPA